MGDPARPGPLGLLAPSQLKGVDGVWLTPAGRPSQHTQAFSPFPVGPLRAHCSGHSLPFPGRGLRPAATGLMSRAGGHKPSCRRQKECSLESCNSRQDLKTRHRSAGYHVLAPRAGQVPDSCMRGRWLGAEGHTAQSSPTTACPRHPHNCGPSPKPGSARWPRLLLHHSPAHFHPARPLRPSLGSPGLPPPPSQQPCTCNAPSQKPTCRWVRYRPVQGRPAPGTPGLGPSPRDPGKSDPPQLQLPRLKIQVLKTAPTAALSSKPPTS